MAWPNDVTRADLRIEFKRGSGKGGQNRNKRDTACRMTHIPTGETAVCEDQRSQLQNRTVCFERLAAKLVPLMKAALKRGPALEISKEIVRTYHQPDQRVTDKRLNGAIFGYDSVIYGAGLGDIIDSLVREAR